MMRLARKHSETGSRTVAGTMLILNFVHLRRFKDRIQNKIHEIYTHFVFKLHKDRATDGQIRRTNEEVQSHLIMRDWN